MVSTRDTRSACIYILGHVQLCSDLLLTVELHDQILVSGLALPDWYTQSELVIDKQRSASARARGGKVLTMNNTC